MDPGKYGWKMKLIALSVLFNFLFLFSLFTSNYKIESIQTKLQATQTKLETTQTQLQITQSQLVVAQKQICTQASESNLNQHKLWDGILVIVPNSKNDPQRLAQFENLLDTTFPPHVCL